MLENAPIAKGDQNREAEHNDRRITVHVKHLSEHEKVSFKVVLSQTLQQVWDEAYLELEIARSERDVFQAPHKPNPIDLMPHITLTLDEARKRDLCKDDFEIAAGTGGA
jgi:hypothetical protein